jgi:hypothetical protein
MAVSTDEEKVKMLKSIGVPISAMRTTLGREKEDTLRTFIQEKKYMKNKHDYKGIFMHQRRPVHVVRARHIFFVTAKEMLLSGLSVYVTTLGQLAQELTQDYDSDRTERINESTILFILGFYERGSGFPLDYWKASVVRDWILGRFEMEKSVCLLSGGTLKDATAWWSEDFLTSLSEHVEIFPIG